MMSNKLIRVLVIDDSALIREMVSDAINQTDAMEVVGTASDGIQGLEQVRRLQPDVVTLDIKMPKMNGLDTLDQILQTRPVPVVMFSSLTQRAADITLDALDRGALDYLAKPNDGGLNQVIDELLRKIRAFAGADVERVLRIRRARAVRTKARVQSQETTQDTGALQNCCIAIGISTGGPPALSQLFQMLVPPLPPIVIVQHMPAQFTGPFALRLDAISPLSIKEAESGDLLKPNHVLVAPGGRHLHLVRQGSTVVSRIGDGEAVSRHKPSVDVMMNCAAKIFENRCLGIVMTGMGRDGSDGCAAIRSHGGIVLGQDEKSSDVYGMNKVAFVEGNVDRQFSLDELPELLSRQVNTIFTGARSRRLETAK